MIKELIVVEGKNDAHVVRRALGKVDIVWTEGYGLTQAKLAYIAEAAKRQGVIVFTDPDSVGEQIRERIRHRVPEAKHVYLAQALARKGEDIGVENAGLEEIRRAFDQIHVTRELDEGKKEFSSCDLVIAGLVGQTESAVKRKKLGHALGIGDANAKQFLIRLNRFGITKAEFEQAMEDLDGKCR